MFRNWGFLISEMFLLILLAALLGLLVGWLIWGRRSIAIQDSAELDRLKSELAACQEAHRNKDAQLASQVDYDGDGIFEGENEGQKPSTLTAARNGQADDLKLIKGVGTKLEALCNRLGFYHFDQVANWTPDEVAWVDANLDGFKGRVSRDNWVSQAKILAAGGSTEFSERAGQ